MSEFKEKTMAGNLGIEDSISTINMMEKIICDALFTMELHISKIASNTNYSKKDIVKEVISKDMVDLYEVLINRGFGDNSKGILDPILNTQNIDQTKYFNDFAINSKELRTVTNEVIGSAIEEDVALQKICRNMSSEDGMHRIQNILSTKCFNNSEFMDDEDEIMDSSIQRSIDKYNQKI